MTKEEINQNVEKIVRELFEAESYDECLNVLSAEDYQQLSDKFLLMFFLNERASISKNIADNKLASSQGIKNKFKNYNPEHIMGYELKTKPNGTYLKPLKDSPFKVCSAENFNIDELFYENNPIYETIEEISENKITISTRPKFKDYPVIASLNNSQYLYDKKTKSILFNGPSPITLPFNADLSNDGIKKVFEESSSKKAHERLLDPEEELLTFEELVKVICNCCSHDSYISTKNYFIFPRKNIYRSDYVAVDKLWLKAVAETIISSKSDNLSEDKILAELQAYMGDNNKLPLNDFDFSFKDFLNATFNINPNTCDYLNNKLKDLLNKEELSSEEDLDCATSLIGIHQASLRDLNPLLNSAQLPSIAYLYLISFISDASMINPNTNQGAKELYSDFTRDFVALLKDKGNRMQAALSPIHKKRIYADLLAGSNEVISEYQNKHDLVKDYFNTCSLMSMRNVKNLNAITSELNTAMASAALFYKVNDIYSNVVIPYMAKNPTKRAKESVENLNLHTGKFRNVNMYNLTKRVSMPYENSAFYFSNLFSSIKNSMSHSQLYLQCPKNDEPIINFFHSFDESTMSEAEKIKTQQRTKSGSEKLITCPLSDFMALLDNDFYADMTYKVHPSYPFFDVVNLSKHDSFDKSCHFSKKPKTFSIGTEGKSIHFEEGKRPVLYDTPVFKPLSDNNPNKEK